MSGWEETEGDNVNGGGNSSGWGVQEGNSSGGWGGSGGFGGGGGGGFSGGGFSGGGGGGFSGGGGGGFSGGGGGNRACFKCGEEGHMSRECPQGGGGGGGGSRACFKCGEEGHMSRECPQGGGGGGGNRACYKCGEEGHMSRECPQGGGGGGGGSRACFKCGEEGHMSRECPKNEQNSSGGFSSTNRGGFGNDQSNEGGFGSKSNQFGGGFENGGGFSGGNDDAAGGGGFGQEGSDRPIRDDKCRRCGESGHFAKDCEAPPDPSKPAPVNYIPPEPSENEEDMFLTITQGINFNKYDNIPVEVTGTIPSAIREFGEACIDKVIMDNIERAKYTKPTPVQKHALPIILAERDLMSCAQTGSGKTAAFLIPVINYILQNRDQLTSSFAEVQAPLALVIAPTRELVMQIQKEARKFSYGTSVRAVMVYGGVQVAHQLRQVDQGCHLLVATPGRLKDFLGRRKISLANIKYLILDEADRMLDMGFMPDIKTIVNDFDMPPKGDRRVLMFSATFPVEIQTLAAEFLSDYVYLTIGKVGSTHTDIKQTVIEVDEASKRDKLVEILNEEGSNRNLVFVQTKRGADFLASFLSQNGYPTTSIHGDRQQMQREEALRDFRSGKSNVLIATAVAARGLDIADVKQVINYDLPDEIDEYIHRIGRTGRIGNKGEAVSFFSAGKDEALARALVKILADAEQDVPKWLELVAETALGTGYGPKGGRFASKDTRNNNFGGDSFDTPPVTNHTAATTTAVTSGDEDWD